jgi:hypothetical protein
MIKQKRSIFALAVLVAFVATGLFLPGLIGAGDLEPTDPPDSTMHTLEDIYNKVANIGTASVEETGQETSYATGDDGDYEVGVSWPVPRFTDNGDGTVTDNLTRLIWLKNANCFKARQWAEALGDCNSLNDGECGLTDGTVEGDWRLPNVRELHSLSHFGFYDPAVPNTAGTGKWAADDPFTGVQSSFYWSSTTFEGDTYDAWNVSMYDGLVSYYDKADLDGLYVWPVRGGN